MAVRDELKKWRQFYRKEFQKRGSHPRAVGRMLGAAEGKFKALFDGAKITVHPNLSSIRLADVEAFYKKYGNDPRLIKLRDEKNLRNGTSYTTTLPGAADMNIFAQALNLPDLAFATTDDHFYILINEMETEFNILIIHDENAHERMREWGWV